MAEELPGDSSYLADRHPRFEDPTGYTNVTVQLGGTAFLNCKVMDLHDKTVRLYELHLNCNNLLQVNLVLKSLLDIFGRLHKQ